MSEKKESIATMKVSLCADVSKFEADMERAAEAAKRAGRRIEDALQVEIGRTASEATAAKRHEAIAVRLDEIIRLLRELCEGQHITVKL